MRLRDARHLSPSMAGFKEKCAESRAAHKTLYASDRQGIEIYGKQAQQNYCPKKDGVKT